VFIISLILVSIFLVSSMLVSLLIRNQAFALIIGTILVYVSNNADTTSFVVPLAKIFPGYGPMLLNLFANYTPTGPLPNIRNHLFSGSFDLASGLQSIVPDMAMFLIFVGILCVLSYIVFIRSDVS
jgi:ABC-2 type transport system permease protein